MRRVFREQRAGIGAGLALLQPPGRVKGEGDRRHAIGVGIADLAGDPARGAEIAIDWWRARGEDPKTKRVIFSDGLDVEEIERLSNVFRGRVKVGFGWGTLLTNDFRDLVPDDRLAPFSLVCKAVAANGRPTVKLSDNPNKALGPKDEVERYRRVFGVGKQTALDLVV